MRDLQPFMIAVGILCAWPAFIGVMGYMVGKNGLPFQLSERWKRKPKQPPIELKRRSAPAPQPTSADPISAPSGD